jgi:hypothetical protein
MRGITGHRAPRPFREVIVVGHSNLVDIANMDGVKSLHGETQDVCTVCLNWWIFLAACC